MVSTKRVRISTSGRFQTAVWVARNPATTRLASSGPRIGETPPPAEGDVDSTLNSIGAANGVTQTAIRRLTGTGTGTYKRSDGCRATWTAIK